MTAMAALAIYAVKGRWLGLRRGVGGRLDLRAQCEIRWHIYLLLRIVDATHSMTLTRQEAW